MAKQKSRNLERTSGGGLGEKPARGKVSPPPSLFSVFPPRSSLGVLLIALALAERDCWQSKLNIVPVYINVMLSINY